MSNFSPKLEAWTRFAENALNGLLASVENTIPTESAAKIRRLCRRHDQGMGKSGMNFKKKAYSHKALNY